MQRIDVNGHEIAYFEGGSGEQTVVFAHSYLVDHRHFAAQIEAASARFRVVAYDHRDHGSSARMSADYRLDDLAEDAAEVIARTGAAPCHFVGLSTGGFVGIRLAIERPELLRSLVLMDTAADPEPRLKQLKYEAMFLLLRTFGFRPLIGTVMGLMFGRRFLRDRQRQDEVETWRQRICANDPAALIRFGRAIFRRRSAAHALHKIATPTLVIVGEDDRPQPVSRSRRLAEGIEGARLAIIPDAGHLSTVDAPTAVNEALMPFLETQAASA